MTTTELREIGKQALEALPPEQLKVAVEFLCYLEERASNEATEELLKIPGVLDDLAEAERDIAEGRTANWRELRSDV